MSRYRVTETRTLVIDTDEHFVDDDPDAALWVARNLPPGEWDTLDAEVTEL